jgi:hypothetical protein
MVKKIWVKDTFWAYVVIEPAAVKNFAVKEVTHCPHRRVTFHARF